MGMTELIISKASTMRKVLVASWVAAVATYLVDMYMFIPGILKATVFMSAAIASFLASKSPKVFSGEPSSEFEGEDSFSDDNSYAYGSPLETISTLILGMGLSVLFIGTLFSTMHWPGAGTMILAGTITSVVASLIVSGIGKGAMRKYAVATIGTAALFAGLYFTGTREAIKYRDYPELAAARLEYSKNPTSIEAEAKLNYEQFKFGYKLNGRELPQEIEDAYQEFLANPNKDTFGHFIVIANRIY